VSAYEVLSLLLEIGILVFVALEYLWGRPDVVVKREEEQQKRTRRPRKQEPIIYEKEMD
jgi:hypothetical protein